VSRIVTLIEEEIQCSIRTLF